MSDRVVTLPVSSDRSFALTIRDRVQKYGERVALRVKWQDAWQETSWRRLGEQVQSLANALVDLGVGEGETVGILSANRPEWTVADLAALTVRGVSVPLYPTSSLKQVEYILNDAEVRVLCVDNQEHHDAVKGLLHRVPSLKKIIVFDREVRLDGDGTALHLDTCLTRGATSQHSQEVERRLARATQDDLLTIIYTSGTTGEPKGVMLTHSNLFHCLAAHELQLPQISERDVSLCFLPLSHVFERMWTFNVLYRGMVNNYLPNPKDVARFIQEVKPTVMCAVPRFQEKVHSAVYSKLEHASKAKRWLFTWALGVGLDHHVRKRDGLPISWLRAARYKVADALVLHKIREAVGGRIRLFPCAGAPLSAEIEQFFYAAGVFVCCGYGLTETTATVSCNLASGFSFGRVGKPLPGLDVRISPQGEILVRGPTVMVGYYKKPVETAAVLRDGWLHTGDAGEMDDRGELRITERIKDLFKTSNGKYIAPQAIESSLGTDSFIDQVVVIGDQRKFVTALVVPSFDSLEAFARAHHIPFTQRDELLQNPAVLDLFRQRIAHKTVDLAPFERVKRFALLPSALTVDNGEVTPTLKIRRRVVEQRYQDVINRMYSEGRSHGAEVYQD